MSRVRRKFQFLRLVASGGFGDVYLCKEIQESGIGRLVAVKLLKSHWRDSQEVVSRLRDEARLLALLRHKNIITVYSLTSISGRTAVVMEYLDAVDLSEIIEQMSPKQRIPLRVTFAVIADVAQALDAAYNQTAFAGDKPLRVIHRDIKPSNIMIDARGLVKVLDFGVARSDFSGRESQTRELQFGSVEYMAPERLFFEPETPASDIYSLTLTLYECLSTRPFGKVSPKKQIHEERLQEKLDVLMQSLATLPTKIKKSIRAVIEQGLSHDAKSRFTAAEMAVHCRRLEREISGRTLSDWSEKAIPLLQKKRGESEEGSLQGRILDEDSTALLKNDEKPQKPAGNEHTLRMGILAELRQSIEQIEPSDISEHDEMFFEEPTKFHDKTYSGTSEKPSDPKNYGNEITKNITESPKKHVDKSSQSSNLKPARLDEEVSDRTVPAYTDELEEIKTSLMSRMSSKKPFSLEEKNKLIQDSLSEEVSNPVLSNPDITTDTTADLEPALDMGFVPDFSSPVQNSGVLSDGVSEEKSQDVNSTMMLSRKHVKAIGDSYQNQVADTHKSELQTIKILFGVGAAVISLCIGGLVLILLNPSLLEPSSQSDKSEFEISDFDVKQPKKNKQEVSIESLISQVKIRETIEDGILLVAPDANSLSIECEGEPVKSKKRSKKKTPQINEDTVYSVNLRKNDARVHFVDRARIAKCEIMQIDKSRDDSTAIIPELTKGRYNCFEDGNKTCEKE